jgi:inner membrane protein
MPAAQSGATPSLARKFFAVAGLTLLLGIPLLMVFLIVMDRSNTADEVRRSITSAWAADQQFRGPYLVIPFKTISETTVNEGGKQQRTQTVAEDLLVIAPAELKVTAQLSPEVRSRSLFDVVVYQGSLRLAGGFRLPDLTASAVRWDQLELDRAFLVLSVTDAKGLGGSLPQLSLGDQKLVFEPGSRTAPMPGAAVSASVDIRGLDRAPIAFQGELSVRGSTSFLIETVAEKVSLKLQSTWPHPSFIGGFLPDARDVSAEGFQASWSATNLAMNRSLHGRASAQSPMTGGDPSGPAAAYSPSGVMLSNVSMGVALIEPVDLYGQAARAVKYGVLFIALTFLAFFLFDVTQGRAISGVAYTLVGLGLVLFFLLLLAFAEYLSFTPAYLLATVALVGLITSYSKAVLGSWARAGVIGAILTALYAYLYVLLQMDDYALITGSITLFLALAVLMYVTRNIDWSAGRTTG